MKKILIVLLTIIGMFSLIACSKAEEKEMSYKMITMEEAKTIFGTEGDYIILDVRRVDEFESGHIPNAINVPNETIVAGVNGAGKSSLTGVLRTEITNLGK